VGKLLEDCYLDSIFKDDGSPSIEKVECNHKAWKSYCATQTENDIEREEKELGESGV
jgi:hypothetical protein